LDSFEDLGLTPELIDALGAEGIEAPTALQSVAIPVLRRGNNLVLNAGPGSGLLVAWGAPLLERIGLEGDGPEALVLTATAEVADRLAESLARLATVTGHSVAALGSAWVLPGRAHVLFGTPRDVVSATRDGEISLEHVALVVVDQASMMEGLGELDDVEHVFEFLSKDAQRVVSSLPISDGAADLIERHVKRAVRVPADDASTQDAPKRGEVRFRIVPEPREEGTLALVGELLDDGARHVLVYCRNEDRAADVGDYLTLHGFAAGAPGDSSAPVWLGVDALEARAKAQGIEDVTVLSCDVPADPDTLDRRHSLSSGGVVVILAREVAHMRHTARQAGYTVVPHPPKPTSAEDVAADIRADMEKALQSEDTGPYLYALEPLFERYDPAEIAAAAVAMLRRQTSPSAPAPSSASRAPSRTTEAARPSDTPAWAKLFFGVGERDGLVAGDLLGAITGEAGVAGNQVGRIDIKESHTLVEVHDVVARQVIKAINGTTIKGRSVRADFDRPKRGAGGSRKPRPRQ
jgi:ATP-dependent RNA helicase DeaD